VSGVFSNDDPEQLLETGVNQLGLSAGAYSGVLNVGRTIADRAGSEEIEGGRIGEAVEYRSLDRRL